MMTVPLWCLLPAVLYPYVWTGVAAAERKKQFGDLDNKHPRVQQQKAEGSAARAQGAASNAFEALGVFGPAVLVAHAAQADAAWSMWLAIAWVVLRLLHGIFYVANIAPARTASFALALFCALGQFVLAGMAG